MNCNTTHYRANSSSVPGDPTSLVELLIAMSLCSAIISMTTVLMQRVMRTQQSSRKCLDVERTAFRLGSTFRNDVHVTSEAKLDNAKEQNGFVLRLSTSKSEAIEYRASGHAMERRKFVDDKPVTRDTFDFPKGVRIAAEVESKTVTISLSPPPTEQRFEPIASAAYAQVSAVLGRRVLSDPPASRPEPKP